LAISSSSSDSEDEDEREDVAGIGRERVEFLSNSTSRVSLGELFDERLDRDDVVTVYVCSVSWKR